MALLWLCRGLKVSPSSKYNGLRDSATQMPLVVLSHRVYNIDVDPSAISIVYILEVPGWRSHVYSVQPPQPCTAGTTFLHQHHAFCM